jgi:hypothetical protein
MVFLYFSKGIGTTLDVLAAKPKSISAHTGDRLLGFEGRKRRLWSKGC